jgi:hypothetical protein
MRKLYSFKYSLAVSFNFAHNWLKPIDLSASAILSGHCFLTNYKPQFYVFRAISNHHSYTVAGDAELTER